MIVSIFNAFPWPFGGVVEARAGDLVNLFNRGYIYLGFQNGQVEK